MRFTHVLSPVGVLLLAGNDDGLKFVGFPKGSGHMEPQPGWVEDPLGFGKATTQFVEYFTGNRLTFELDLAPDGTPFQKEVWQALRAIPYGETTSYSDIARRIGRPAAVRAVGAANGRNPLPIVIPCHRVIGKDGSLTGFGGGLRAKETLLALEKSVLQVPRFSSVATG